MKRPIVIFTTTGILMGSLAALLARSLLHTPEPDAATRWLEPYEIRTPLDLGPYHLAAPNGRPGNRSWYGGTDLYVFRDGQYYGITAATALAQYVRQVRGSADGDEFWRLVRDFDLDLPVSRPPPKSTTASMPEEETDRNPIADAPWWYDYDRGIEPGARQPDSPRVSSERSMICVAFPNRTSLASTPEFLASGPGFILYRLSCRDDRVGLLSCEMTLEPSRLTLSSPVEVQDR